jgi:hypothetical protein
MATFTSEATGNFTSNVVWGKAAGAVEGVNYPGPNDDIVLGATYVVTLDLTTAPSTGTYNSISGNGQLSIVMDANDVVLSATTITAGTVGATGSIALSGAAPTKTLTITGNIVGAASGTNTRGLVKTSTCALVINGNATGGAAGNGFGVSVTAAGAITVNNITGGAGVSAYGLSIAAASAPVTIVNNCTGGGFNAHGFTTNQASQTWSVGGNIIDGSVAPAYAGKVPTWTPTAANYYQVTAGKLALEVAAANLKKDIVNGTVTGTYAFNVNGISVTGPA